MFNTIQSIAPAITNADIDRFESVFAIRLPPRYRTFLLQSNGGRPKKPQFRVPGWPGESTYADIFYGLGDSRELTLDFWLKEHEDRLPPGFITIGVDVWGNPLCLDTQPPYADHIYYWDSSNRWDLPPEGPTMFEVAKDIQSFIDGMTEEDPVD